MSTDRLLAIYELIALREREGTGPGLLCTVAAQITRMDGAGVEISSIDNSMTGLCSSSPTSVALMDFEKIAGEGPSKSANVSEVAIDGSDLTMELPPWPVYTPMALSVGVRAVFGFPIRLGAVRLGALSLFRREVGGLSEDQYSDGYLVASVIGRSLLAMESGARSGELSEELQRHSTLDFAVHQAAGMISVQGAMSVKDALVALRSHAFARSTGIADVAVQVISRRSRYVRNQGFVYDANY
ncbi:MAG: hypothetical protein HKL86_08120 [Acidimicrobiaceae bacterium]|nr:hypothetical protein [Acidimicrobiaceae bacterium]